MLWFSGVPNAYKCLYNEIVLYKKIFDQIRNILIQLMKVNSDINA